MQRIGALLLELISLLCGFVNFTHALHDNFDNSESVLTVAPLRILAVGMTTSMRLVEFLLGEKPRTARVPRVVIVCAFFCDSSAFLPFGQPKQMSFVR